jgi:ethanolamine ammonia-lyase large subunit
MLMLGAAGCNFIMGVPGSDDIMLNYQSTSFHDALVLRQLLGLRAAPEFEAWQQANGITTAGEAPQLAKLLPAAFALALGSVGRVSTRQVD